MTKELFQNPNINPGVLIKQRRRGVAKFMRRNSHSVKAGFLETFFNDLLNAPRTDSLASVVEKERVFIDALNFFSGIEHGEIIVNGCKAGIVEINDSFFVAFAEQLQTVVVNVGNIDSTKLGKPHSAV